MARIQFTKAAIQKNFDAGYYGFGKTNGPGSAGTGSYNRLMVFKGTIPTQAELRSFQAASIFRSSDLLINFSAGGMVEAFEDFKVKFKTTVYTAAQTSGEASWFAFSQGSSSSFRSQSIAIGTVSGLGGAGELKISDTNIIAGNSYIIKPMEIILPFKFDF